MGQDEGTYMHIGGDIVVIGGDFNTILSPRDRAGSDTNRQAEMIDFAETIEDCRLLDPGFDGADYTWAKNGWFERLDRVLVSESWTRFFDATRVTNLPRVSSDHGPILVRCKLTRNTTGGRAFRFQNMWTRHDEFFDLVREDWLQPTGAGGLLNLQFKLARLKKTLKGWNKEVIGNIHTNLRDMEEAVATAQADFQADPSARNRTKINKLIARYILLLKMEEDFWRQKATLRWLADGDKNTKFYQSWVKQKRVRLRIHKILVNGLEITDEPSIKNSAVEFFHNLLAPDTPELSEPDLSLIQHLPPSTQLDDIAKPPNADEVKPQCSISLEIVPRAWMASRPPSSKHAGVLLGRIWWKQSCSSSTGLISPEASQRQVLFSSPKRLSRRRGPTTGLLAYATLSTRSSQKSSQQESPLSFHGLSHQTRADLSKGGSSTTMSFLHKRCFMNSQDALQPQTWRSKSTWPRHMTESSGLSSSRS